MGLDPEVEAALPRFFGTDEPPSDDPIAAGRRRLEAIAAHGPDPGRQVAARDIVIPAGEGEALPARAYAPEGACGPVLVFFHGGGWVSGSLDSHDVFCRAFAGRLSATVVSVGYRLAPSTASRPPSRTPGWRRGWLPLIRVRSACRARVWSSAETAQAARSRPPWRAGRETRASSWPARSSSIPSSTRPAPRGSYDRYAEGYGLTRVAMEYQWRTYLDGADPDDPDASPLRCRDLRALAPAVVITAECDVLRDEAEEYAARMREAGVAVHARRYDGLVHGFLRIGGEVPAARAAFDDLIALTARAFGYSETRPG